MEQYYLWIKSFHLIAVISWMAGILYLPRLFVYHTRAAINSDLDNTLKVMEQKLLRVIMNPAMIVTFLLGLLLVKIYGIKALGLWFHIKLGLVFLLTIMHGLLAKWRKDFAIGANKHSEKFYRLINEIPAILMIFVIILVIVKPFE